MLPGKKIRKELRDGTSGSNHRGRRPWTAGLDYRPQVLVEKVSQYLHGSLRSFGTWKKTSDSDNVISLLIIG